VAASWPTAAASRAGVPAGWDAATAAARLGAAPTQAQLRKLYAAAGSTPAASHLPHHAVAADGRVGDPEIAACHAAIGALNTGTPALFGDARRAAYKHLADHVAAAGGAAETLVDAAAPHGPYDGSHSHSHAAMGAQGDDQMHEHTHSHSGDAVHNHPHDASASSKGADMDFTAEQLAAVRTRLGLAADAEVSAAQVMAALAAPAAPAPAATGQGNGTGADDGTGEGPGVLDIAASLPPGVVAIDQGSWEALQAQVQQGVAANARMLRSERDTALEAAIGQGKFSRARRDHWVRLWDKDPEGTKNVLATLARNTIPVADVGLAGGDVEDPEMDAEFAGIYPAGQW
jgi:hypothetical protein